MTEELVVQDVMTWSRMTEEPVVQDGLMLSRMTEELVVQDVLTWSRLTEEPVIQDGHGVYNVQSKSSAGLLDAWLLICQLQHRIHRSRLSNQ
eukprot:gene28684-35588_t